MQSTIPTRNPRVGVAIIIRRGEDVLLVRRRNVHGDGTWAVPGGHLDYGESPEECAIREAHEETEVTVDQVRFRAITNDLFTDEQKHYITIWMEGRDREGTARPKAAYELSQVGWFTWDRLPTPLFAPLRRLLDGECYPAPHLEP